MKMTVPPPTIRHICCPNCGKEAYRRYFKHRQVIETSCPACDYLLISSLSGQVIEAYAPGIAC